MKAIRTRIWKIDKLAVVASSALILTSIFVLTTRVELAYAEDPSFDKIIEISGKYPSYMVATGGNIYVMWMQNKILLDGGVMSTDVFFRTIKDDGSSLGSVINLAKSDGRIESAQFVISGNYVYAVWRTTVPDPYTTPKGEIFFTRSADGGASFSNPIRLGGDEGIYGPQIAVSGNNVYVLWAEGEVGKADILFNRSTDNGATFDKVVNIGRGWSPKLAASEKYVYVVWDSGDIFFTRSTDNGRSFELPVNLSNDKGFSGHSQIAVFGKNVYVVWADDVVWSPNTPGKRDILFVRSIDNGASFDPVVNLSRSGDAEFPKISVSGKYVYVEWFKESNAGPKLLTVSKDSGATFGSVINLTNKFRVSISAVGYYGSNVYVVWMNSGDAYFSVSRDNGNTFEGVINLSKEKSATISPNIIVSDNKIYVIWGKEGHVLFRVGTILTSPSEIINDILEPISINYISNSKPRWGLDEVVITGIVSKPSSLDTITIDWGDGTTSNVRFIKSDGSWGPVSHIYDVEHAGKKQIVAKLFSGRVLKASSIAYEVDVQKHATSITINPISNVEPGSSITVKGTLFDTDAKVGVTGRLITFNATGIEDLSSTVTFRDGVFSSKGMIPTKPNNIAVQAQFEGDSVYLPSSSSVQKYGTVETIIESIVQLSNIALVDSDGNELNKISTGERVLIQGNLVNKQNKEQPLVYIVQIKDRDGHTVFLSWIKGSIQNSQSMKAAVAWTSDVSGNYTVEIFVWESVTNQRALSEVSRIKLTVS